MKKKTNKTNLPGQKESLREKKDIEENLLYPASEDIYNRSRELENTDPEDFSKRKVSNEDDKDGNMNEKSFKDDVSGDDLDVPGSELDDAAERNGEEDEENNYYSLGDNK